MTTDDVHVDTPIRQPGFGRVWIPDDRDHDWLAQRQIPARNELDDDAAKAVERGWRYWWADGWWGDQARTPQCVAYAMLHWLEDGPYTRAPHAPQRDSVHGRGAAIMDPQLVYDQAREIDAWPGTDYDGTSVRAGAKILRRHGYVSEFRWAYDMDTVVDAVLRVGPVVFGTRWPDAASRPDDEGVIDMSGPGMYGHAYKLNGVNVRTNYGRIKNSWGRGWGSDGHAYVKLDQLEALLADRGEACLLVPANPA